MKKITVGSRMQSPYADNKKRVAEQNEQFKKLCAEHEIELEFVDHGNDLTDELMTIWDNGIDSGRIPRIE